MTYRQQLGEISKDMQKYTKRALRSKKSVQTFLVELGTHNTDGTLTDNYK
jgi:hypothetical protein